MAKFQSKPAPAAAAAAERKTEAKAEPAKAQAVKKAFTVERVPGGWVFVTLTYDGQDKVVSVTRTEPDLKTIALEAFKIAAFNYWTKEVNV